MFCACWDVFILVYWLISRKPVFVIEFDALKHNLINTMREAVKFLDLTTTEDVLQCTQTNSEGGFHRAKTNNQSDFLIIPERYIELLYEYKNITQWYLERRCPQLPWCLDRSEVEFVDPPYTLTPRKKPFKPKKTWWTLCFILLYCYILFYYVFLIQ